MALTDIFNRLVPAVRHSRMARRVRDGTTASIWALASNASLYSRAALLDDIDADLTAANDDLTKGAQLALAREHMNRLIAELHGFARNYATGVFAGPGRLELESAGYNAESLATPEATMRAVAERVFAENRYVTANTITIGAPTAASGVVGSMFPSVTAASEFVMAGAVETSTHPGIMPGTITLRVTAIDPSTNQPTVSAKIVGGLLWSDKESAFDVPVVVPNLRRLTAAVTNDFTVARGADGLIGNAVLRNSTSDTAATTGVPYGSTGSGVGSKILQSTAHVLACYPNRNDRLRVLRLASAAGAGYNFKFAVPLASGGSVLGVARPGDRLEAGFAYWSSGVTAGSVTLSLLSGASHNVVVKQWTINSTSGDWTGPSASTVHRFTLDRLSSGLAFHASASSNFAGSLYLGYMQIVKCNLPPTTQTGVPPIVVWPGDVVSAVGDTATFVAANNGAGVWATELVRLFGNAGRLPTQTDRKAGSTVIADPAVT